MDAQERAVQAVVMDDVSAMQKYIREFESQATDRLFELPLDEHASAHATRRPAAAYLPASGQG